MPKEKKDKETKKSKASKDLDFDLSDINIEEMLNEDEENRSNQVKLGNVVTNMEALNKAANNDDLDYAEALVRYIFANDEDRPIRLEKVISDGDARLKEVSTLNAVQSQLSIYKLNSLQQTLIDDIVKSVENIAFLSLPEKLATLNTVNAAIEKTQKSIFEHIKMSSDFNSMPTIYRQLVSKLMMMPDNKIERYKLIPDLIELPDEIWERVVEIINIWNKQ